MRQRGGRAGIGEKRLPPCLRQQESRGHRWSRVRGFRRPEARRRGLRGPISQLLKSSPVSTGAQRMWAASPSSAEEDSEEAELHPGEGARSLAHSIAEDPETPGLAPDLGQKGPTTARAPSGRGHGRAPASLTSRTGSRPGAQATRGPEDRMAGKFRAKRKAALGRQKLPPTCSPWLGRSGRWVREVLSAGGWTPARGGGDKLAPSVPCVPAPRGFPWTREPNPLWGQDSEPTCAPVSPLSLRFGDHGPGGGPLAGSLHSLWAGVEFSLGHKKVTGYKGGAVWLVMTLGTDAGRQETRDKRLRKSKKLWFYPLQKTPAGGKRIKGQESPDLCPGT